MLNSIKCLIDLCISVRPVTHKPGGFRALDVERPKGLNNLSKKELRSQTNYYIYLLTSFDANTQCLIRQEVRLLNEVFFFFFFCFPSHPSHKTFKFNLRHSKQLCMVYNLKSYPTSKMPIYFVIFKFFNTCILIAKGE
jgi:hypothetical protein